VKPEIAQRLLELNRQFYTEFSQPFSATRARLQPGVRRVLEAISGDESILDLGCGNGGLARALAARGHQGAYLGLDFSPPLLAVANSLPEDFTARFLAADLSSEWDGIVRSAMTSACSKPKQMTPQQKTTRASVETVQNEVFDLIFSFATLHHVPSLALRLAMLKKIRMLLAPGGRFIHSNWQFLRSPRLRQRVRAWSEASLADSDVDPGDFLLDWRSGGLGLRYVHHFESSELAELAEASGFTVVEVFYSDGKEGDLSVYQVWADAQAV